MKTLLVILGIVVIGIVLYFITGLPRGKSNKKQAGFYEDSDEKLEKHRTK